MFKVGDKVVCIQPQGETEYLKSYTIKYITYKKYIILENIMWAYLIHSFISISEYRKLKLNKINK